jgi:hypothetical protein
MKYPGRVYRFSQPDGAAGLPGLDDDIFVTTIWMRTFGLMMALPSPLRPRTRHTPVDEDVPTTAQACIWDVVT